MPFFTFITFPSVSSTLAEVGTISAPVVSEFLPAAYFILGWTIGTLVVGFIIAVIIRALRSFFAGHWTGRGFTNRDEIDRNF